MKPEVDNDRVTVFRTAVGLLTIPKVQTEKGQHAINSAISGVLAEVVNVHETLETMTPEKRGRSFYLLNGARHRVSGLTNDFLALQKQGTSADIIRSAEVAQREMLSNLQRLQTHYGLYQE